MSWVNEAIREAVEDAITHPRITEGEASALHLGSRVLAEVTAALARSGQTNMAEESARSAAALEALHDRAAVLVNRDAEGVQTDAGQEVER